LNVGEPRRKKITGRNFFTIILVFLYGDILCLHFFSGILLCTPVYSLDLFFFSSEIFSMMTNSFLKWFFFFVWKRIKEKKAKSFFCVWIEIGIAFEIVKMDIKRYLSWCWLLRFYLFIKGFFLGNLMIVNGYEIWFKKMLLPIQVLCIRIEKLLILTFYIESSND
jgi:hypothetical protein